MNELIPVLALFLRVEENGVMRPRRSGSAATCPFSFPTSHVPIEIEEGHGRLWNNREPSVR
jgi:hypothetical protein